MHLHFFNSVVIVNSKMDYYIELQAGQIIILSFLKISGNTSGGWIWYLPIFIELAFSAPFL